MLGCRYTTGYPTIIHFLLNSAAQKSYLKLCYLSIPPNRAPTVHENGPGIKPNGPELTRSITTGKMNVKQLAGSLEENMS